MPNSIPSTDDNVLTAAEVARLLSVSEFTLLRMRQRPSADGLPFVKLSANRIGYIRRDVLAFLAARRVGILPLRRLTATRRPTRRSGRRAQPAGRLNSHAGSGGSRETQGRAWRTPE